MKTARVLVLVAGLGIVACGLVAVPLALALARLFQGDKLPLALTFSVSFAFLCLSLGGALAVQAWNALQGRPSRPFAPRRVWTAALLLILAILVGHAALSSVPLRFLAFPPLHVLAASLPPFIILALVGRGLPGTVRWREVILQYGSGAFLSTSVAVMLELALIVGLMLALFSYVAIQPGGPAQLDALMERLQDPTLLADPSQLAQAASTPVIWAGLMFAAAFAVPMIEEAAKGLGVGLMSYRQMNLSQAFLSGLASGAGFATVEALFNSLVGFDAWAMAVSVRVPATLMHCLTGSLTGLAWHRWLARRHWMSGTALYGTSVAIHGAWNALAVAMTLVSLRSGELSPASALPELDTPAAGALAGGLACLTIASAACLVILTRYIRQRSGVAIAESISIDPALSR